jgi:hypothetical protein
MKTEINVVSSALQTPLPAGQGFATGFLGGELAVLQSRGKYAMQCQSGKLWWAYKTSFTVPTIAAQLASIFSVYNPIGSGVNLELVSLEIGGVNATTVVSTIGLAAESNLTLTPVIANMTAGTAYNGLLGSAVSHSGGYYTKWTHVGTPVMIGGFIDYGAVTNTGAGRYAIEYDGKIILTPGSVVSLAASTGTPTTIDAAISWLEVPAY